MPLQKGEYQCYKTPSLRGYLTRTISFQCRLRHPDRSKLLPSPGISYSKPSVRYAFHLNKDWRIQILPIIDSECWERCPASSEHVTSRIQWWKLYNKSRRSLSVSIGWCGSKIIIVARRILWAVVAALSGRRVQICWHSTGDRNSLRTTFLTWIDDTPLILFEYTDHCSFNSKNNGHRSGRIVGTHECSRNHKKTEPAPSAIQPHIIPSQIWWIIGRLKKVNFPVPSSLGDINIHISVNFN